MTDKRREICLVRASSIAFTTDVFRSGTAVSKPNVLESRKEECVQKRSTTVSLSCSVIAYTHEYIKYMCRTCILFDWL